LITPIDAHSAQISQPGRAAAALLHGESMKRTITGIRLLPAEDAKINRQF
jgi:hypothetical protein